MDFGSFTTVAAISTVAAVVWFWIYMQRRRQGNQVGKSGIAAEATITGRTVQKSRGSVVGYLVTFHFEIEKLVGLSESFTKTQTVSEQHYQTLVEGTKVPIRYQTANPERTAQLDGMFVDNSGAITFLILGVVFLIPLVLVAGASGVTVIQNGQATQTAATDFAAARAVIEPHMAQWQADKSQGNHDIPSANLGLGNNHISEVDYGYCSDGTFYIYTLYAPGGQFESLYALELMVTDALTYTSKPDDGCAPPNWDAKREPTTLDGGWYVSQVDIPLNVPTPKPK